MQDVVVEFGKNLTVISGLNGTGKSTILGLAGHIFSFREKGVEIKYKHKTLDKKPYETEYSEIFRFCPTHDINKTREYEYEVEITSDDQLIKKLARSRHIKSENRFRIDVGDRAKEGEGKVNHPVIYLGLKRLFPIAQENEEDVVIEDSQLEVSDINFYKKESDAIFVSLDKTIAPQHVKTPHKDFFATETQQYGTLGNSAGQDNLGQILTAILSFKKLNQGGILLIDELDTAMFAGAQINLIKRLYGYAKQENLQIIFTTHSLEVISFLIKQKYDGTKINFLELVDRKVKNSIDPDFQYIKSRIMMETKEEPRIEKIAMVCEDEPAAIWCRNLITGHSVKKRLEVYGAQLSNGAIADLAARKLKCFNRIIFVLDGDGRNEARFKKLKNRVFLPGTKAPETVLYEFLNDLNEVDDFWGGERHFYKNTCFNGFTNEKSKQVHKKWFEKNKQNFGRGGCKLIRRWKTDNSADATNFIHEVENILNTIA